MSDKEVNNTPSSLSQAEIEEIREKAVDADIVDKDVDVKQDEEKMHPADEVLMKAMGNSPDLLVVLTFKGGNLHVDGTDVRSETLHWLTNKVQYKLLEREDLEIQAARQQAMEFERVKQMLANGKGEEIAKAD